MKMKVRNLVNSKGNEVKNQFVITVFDCDGNATLIFQSYESVICEVSTTIDGMTLKFGRDYDYSRTTMKHLNTFLTDYVNGIKTACKHDIDVSIKNGYWFDNPNIAVKYDKFLH